MRSLDHLLENNRRWAEMRTAQDAQYFDRLKDAQNPDYLWIGCADSRVPATQIVGLKPGDLFEHRNVANLARPDDRSVQCVLEYGVNVLDVDHIIVCGHYGCGGVGAALGPSQPWAVERWIETIRSVATRRNSELDGLDDAARARRLSELNVEAQVEFLRGNAILRDAWMRGNQLTVHGWIYDVATGRVRDMEISGNTPI